jgi:dipeptidyl aminopeptidase/acylaminoacyl peptidase
MRETVKLATQLGLIVLVMVLLACTPSSSPDRATKPTPTLEKPMPSISPSSKIQLPPNATATVGVTRSTLDSLELEESATPTPRLGSMPLTEVRIDGDILKAFWSEDGQTIYIALKLGSEVRWKAYQIATRMLVDAESPLKYDDTIWQRLQIPKPAGHLELKGLFSPSGERVIYEVSQGIDVTSNPPGKTEIWITTRDGQRKTKIYQQNYVFGILKVVWFDNENQALLGIGTVGPSGFLLVNYSQGSVADLGISTDTSWAFSPIGERLALMQSFEGPLEIVSLRDQLKRTVVDTLGYVPTWSTNGERLYYWWGNSYDSVTSYDSTSELRVYDVTRGEVVKLIDTSSIRSRITGSPEFIVSPQEDRIAMWNYSLLQVLTSP